MEWKQKACGNKTGEKHVFESLLGWYRREEGDWKTAKGFSLYKIKNDKIYHISELTSCTYKLVVSLKYPQSLVKNKYT